MARRAGLLSLWALTVAMMVMDHVGDPYDPTRQGTAVYGHNAPGTLELGIGVSLIELLVVWAILRPESYVRSWGRAALALVVLAPWAFASALATMHASGIFVIHLLWVLALAAACFILLVWSGTAAALARR